MMKSMLHFVLLVFAVVGVTSRRSRCGVEPCPPGEDCFNVRGSFLQCADPCVHHSALNESWRATDISSVNKQLHCDHSTTWKGWYRMFLQDTRVAMPESCVEAYRCGTDIPLWLVGSHPKLEEGVAQRNVCGNWISDCCHIKPYPILVKACRGNFYVYKFVKPSHCHLAYCADASSKICESCEDNEMCVRSKGSWTCEVQEAPAEVHTKLLCGRRIFELGLLGSYLEHVGLNASSAHLADRLCSAHQQRDSRVWYPVERKAGRCGNTLTTNGTHAIYSNTLFVYPNDIAENNSPSDSVSFPFSCIYPADTETSLEVIVRPQLLSVGVGPKARASMSLYRDSNFTGPYPAGPVILPIGAALYVGVTVDEMEASRLTVVLEDCYATDTQSPDDPKRYFLIQNRCPTDSRQVSVAESGSSLRARFSALLFVFQGNYFLHCSLSMCDRSRGSCSPMCRGRRPRSVSGALPLKPRSVSGAFPLKPLTVSGALPLKPRSVSGALPLKPLTVGPIAWQQPG